MPKLGANQQRPASHSDGFSGNEAAPIGKVMAVRKQNRRQQTWKKITIRMGELTLVAERPSNQEDEDPQGRTHFHKKVKKPNPSDGGNRSDRYDSQVPVETQLAIEGDFMLVDGTGNQLVFVEEVLIHGDHEQHQNERRQKTPQVSPNETSILEPPSRSFPLQERKQRIRNVSFKGDTNANTSQAASTQSREPFRHGETNTVSVSQQLKSIPTLREAPKPKRKEIEVPLQVCTIHLLSATLYFAFFTPTIRIF